MIQLAEPAKPAALTFTSDDDVPREAFVTMYDPGARCSTRPPSTSERG